LPFVAAEGGARLLGGARHATMLDFRHILCPTDLSPASDSALRYAAALARAAGAHLSVCHYAISLPPPGTRARAEEQARLRECAAAALAAECGATGLTGLNWSVLVLEGDTAAEAITTAAGECAVDLIVMCSRRRPLRAALLGSTAEAVYRQAPCSVLITHPDDEREWVAGGVPAGRRVLVAHDFSNDSELALRHALAFARQYGAELHLLHVLARPHADGPEVAWTADGTENVYRAAAERLRRAVAAETDDWLAARPAVRWGKPYREVLEYAREQAVELVCMGAHGAGFGLAALFGSNVDRVLRQAPCPVLVARPPRPALPAYATPARSAAATATARLAPEIR
jgi:nucleotide-binding universal stress UspA family protein